MESFNRFGGLDDFDSKIHQKIYLGFLIDCSEGIDETYDGQNTYKDLIEESLNKLINALKKDSDIARRTACKIVCYSDFCYVFGNDYYENISKMQPFSYTSMSDEANLRGNLDGALELFFDSYKTSDNISKANYRRKPKIIVLTTKKDVSKFPSDTNIDEYLKRFDVIFVPLCNNKSIYNDLSKDFERIIDLTKPEYLIDFFKLVFYNIAVLKSKRVIELDEYPLFFNEESEDSGDKN